MSELTPEFFSRLAQQLPGMKRQYGEAARKQRLKRNGILDDGAPCQICGEKFSVKTQVMLQTEHPIRHCPRCEDLLKGGAGAFVTVEKKPRFWIGAGVLPKFAGKVTVVSTEQMDAIERTNKAVSARKALRDFVQNMIEQGKLVATMGHVEATDKMAASEKEQWEQLKCDFAATINKNQE